MKKALRVCFVIDGTPIQENVEKPVGGETELGEEGEKPWKAVGFEVKETVKKKGKGEDEDEDFNKSLDGFFDWQFLVQRQMACGIGHCRRSERFR